MFRRQPGILVNNYHTRVESTANGMTNCAAAIAFVMATSFLVVTVWAKKVAFHSCKVLKWHTQTFSSCCRHIITSLTVLSYLHLGESWSCTGCGTQSVPPGFSQMQKLDGLSIIHIPKVAISIQVEWWRCNEKYLCRHIFRRLKVSVQGPATSTETGYEHLAMTMH